MSFTITIPQTGLHRQKPDLATLQKAFGSAYHIGGAGPFGSFAPQPAAPPENMEALYMLYGAGKAPLGRGFFLSVQKGFAAFELGCALPATEHDLQDLFTFAGLLAGQYGLKDLVCDGQPTAAARLVAAYPAASAANALTLQSMAASKPGFTVSGVRFPVTLTEKLCQRITALPADKCGIFYQSYLNEKQAMDLYYMEPSFSQDDAGQTTALYTLPAGRPCIIPVQPCVPYGPAPFGGAPVQAWTVELLADGIALGRVPYQTLLDALTEEDTKEFDPRHLVLRSFSRRRMQELLEAAGA